MADGDITTRFKVDISDLKKGISQANQQIRLANAEFKAASAGLDNWQKSSEGVTAKLKQLDSILQAQKSKLNAYNSQLQRQQEAYDENGKRADELRAAMQELADSGVSKTSDEYKKLQSALTAVEKEQAANQRSIDKLNVDILHQQAAVNATEAEIGKYTKALDRLETEAREAAQAANRQKTAYESLQDTIDSQQSELDALKKKYADVVLSQGKTSDAAEELANEIDQLSSDLGENRRKLNEADEAADALDRSFDELEDGAGNASDGFTVLKGSLANLVADGIRAAISAIQDFVKETINVGMTFDKSMSNVAALSGATGKELQMLRDTAKEFGSTTQFSASEAADALSYMALAGWDANQSADALGGVLDLAAASQMDLAQASDMVTDYMSAFGMEAKDSAYFADILAYAQANANTTAQGLGEAYKNSAANMNAAGQDIETVTSLLAMMANQGLKGSEAGTALNAVMRDMTAKMKDGAIAIGDTQIQVMDANGNYRDMTDILLDVEAATQGMGDAEKAAALASTFTSDSIKGLNLILNAGVGNAADFEEQLRNSSGAASEMAKIMNDNLGGDLTALGSKFEGVQLALYEKFEPALRSGIDALSGMLDGLQWVIDNGGTIIGVITGLGTAVATYAAITNAAAIKTAAMTAATKLAAGAQAALNYVMNMNPIGIVISLLAGLTAAFVVLWNKSEGFREFWIGLWEKVKAAVQPVLEFLQAAFSAAWDKIKEVWGVVSEWFAAKFQPIIEDLKPVIQAIIQWFQGAWDKIQEVWGKVTAWFKKIFGSISKEAGPVIGNIVSWFQEAWAKVQEVWGVVSEWFSEVFNKIKETAGPILDSIAQAFVNAWELIKVVWDFVKPYFENLWNNIKAVFSVVAPILKGFFQSAWILIKAIWDTVGPYFAAVWNTIKNVFSVVATFFGGMFKTAWEAIKLVWDVVTGYFKAVWDSIAAIFSVVKDVLTGNWQDAWNGIKGIVNTWKGYFSNVWSGIKNVFSSVKSWFSNTFSAAWTAIKNVFSGWTSFFQGLWDKIKNTFSSLGTKLGDAIGGSVKAGINKVLSWVESTINKAIGLINGAINLINKIPGVSIGHIPKLNLPMLATGGVLKRGQVGLLEGSGAEAVVPLEKNKQWIQAVAADMLKQLSLDARPGGAALASSSETTSNVNNFTQNIYAPKQPSRIELYRQTRNLLDFAKG